MNADLHRPDFEAYARRMGLNIARAGSRALYPRDTEIAWRAFLAACALQAQEDTP